MSKPFIKNHQYNVIKKQTEFIQNTLRNVADRSVLSTVRYSALTNIVEAFPDLTEDQQQMLEQISAFETAYDFQRYLGELESYLESYPPITPINKKGYCLFCNRHHELAFFLVKTKPAIPSPDNYAAIGQYVCMDNQVCNQSITVTGSLEKFILSVRK
ncbi:elongation factor G-binding protein [Paenibacillus enshidis]|uniref:Elongation factor G-binding protein n=1 Tax=Paenibacillus enshidis TaxID=1458439 RepID=A0ABV5B0I8_9BACL